MLSISEERKNREIARAEAGEAAARRYRLQVAVAVVVWMVLIALEVLLFGLSFHLTGEAARTVYSIAQVSAVLPAIWLAVWHLGRKDD